MLFGRTVISWVLTVFVALCVFFLARWAVPLLFGAIGVAIPPEIVTILALLIALGVLWGGYTYRTPPPPPA